MPTIGTTTKPNNAWHSYSGSTFPNQEAELLSMPGRGRLLELGAWIGGWNDAPRVRLAVWAADGTLLGQSAQFSVANEGAGGPAGGNVALYVAELETPVLLAKSIPFYCGFSRHPDDKHQVSGGPTGTSHYEGRSGSGNWPTPNTLGHGSGITSAARRIGAYVSEYEPIPGAYVYRSGAWVEADTVYVYRTGAWVEADAVQLYRSSAWVDAE